MSSPTTTGLPKVERSGNVTIITFTRDPVRDVESVLARELLGRAVGTRGCHLLLDFTNVDCLNSMELGTLITLHKKIRDAGGRLTLFNLSDLVFELFAITRLNTLLGICREGVVPIPELLAGDPTEASASHATCV